MKGYATRHKNGMLVYRKIKSYSKRLILIRLAYFNLIIYSLNFLIVAGYPLEFSNTLYRVASGNTL